MLEVTDLETAYGPVRALRGVSFTVPEATITAVLGANGAGKTSLLRTLSGLVRARSGQITLDGENIGRAPVEQLVRRGMAHVPEGRGVIAELSVEENLRLGGLWRGDGGRDGLEDVYELFAPLRERRALEAHTLSGGERQMLAIGRALMAKPRLLLLDEPSLGLAPRVAAQILRLLARLRDETGLTVLLVEQNAKGALSVADRGIVLSLGRVVAADAPAALAADDALRHAYLGF
ncbi:MAG TPA: ABC transporter ATP-binding protein [Baekduia sp.]|jgi:branched-chain amino acid transport system ATP-binding protein|nr:ABC transporter ATP-binding protein [Baekduia sp.]